MDEKNGTFELIEDSDAENTKRKMEYAVSRMYLKKCDIKAIAHFGI